MNEVVRYGAHIQSHDERPLRVTLRWLVISFLDTAQMPAHYFHRLHFNGSPCSLQYVVLSLQLYYQSFCNKP